MRKLAVYWIRLDGIGLDWIGCQVAAAAGRQAGRLAGLVGWFRIRTQGSVYLKYIRWHLTIPYLSILIFKT